MPPPERATGGWSDLTGKRIIMNIRTEDQKPASFRVHTQMQTYVVAPVMSVLMFSIPFRAAGCAAVPGAE